jgi:hypothetical protein
MNHDGMRILGSLMEKNIRTKIDIFVGDHLVRAFLS